MVKIRMTRFGKHNSPFFRIVAIDSKNKRDGKYISLLGTYFPAMQNKPKKIALNEKEILEWLNKGAQPSETVLGFLKEQGIYKKFISQKPTTTKKESKNK